MSPSTSLTTSPWSLKSRGRRLPFIQPLEPEMRRRILIAAVVMVVFATMLFGLISAVSFCRRARQLRTFVDMQIISRQAEMTMREHGKLDEAGLTQAVHSAGDGRDAWGNNFILLLDVESDDLRYLLVSRGSDSVLDVANAAEYFEMQEVSIKGNYKRDIVFLNGVPLTIAGK